MMANKLAVILEMRLCRLFQGPRDSRRVPVVVEATNASVLPPSTDVVAEYHRGSRMVSPELLTSADVADVVFGYPLAETCYKPRGDCSAELQTLHGYNCADSEGYMPADCPHRWIWHEARHPQQLPLHVPRGSIPGKAPLQQMQNKTVWCSEDATTQEGRSQYCSDINPKP